jgi:hypothetical protein
MQTLPQSTIAQLLFTAPPRLNFPTVVEKLEKALTRFPASRRALAWDCDDVAMFDLDGSRIALGYTEDLEGEYAACLTVSVGAGTQFPLAAPLAQNRDQICAQIIESLSARFPCDRLDWSESDLRVTPDVIDALVEDISRPATELGPMRRLTTDHLRLDSAEAAPPKAAAEIDRLMERMSVELEGRRPKSQPWMAGAVAERASRSFLETAARLKSRAQGNLPLTDHSLEESTVASNDAPDLPKPRSADLGRIRQALYRSRSAATTEAEPSSTQMRLAVHALNCTLTVVYLPVGAALMTYSFFRGEDIRLSGRMMAATGALLTLSEAQFGGTILSMI